MHRIDTATKATDLFGPGKHGFKDGDPLTGDPASMLNAAWFNSVQEELCGLVEAAGLTPGVDNTQVLRALKKLLAPAGTVSFFPSTVAPAGYTELNGTLLSRVTYADHWAFAQSSGNIVSDAAWSTQKGAFSTGDGTTTFRVPDYRGEFLRAWDNGRGVDSGRAIGSTQGDNVRGPTGGGNLVTSATSIISFQGGSTHTGQLIGAIAAFGTSAAETRPRNVALLCCIRT
ncbi:Phage tail fiber protein [Azospirillum argentinense]|uniref:hypothetical protein n=1 Tax=Azospirillum argentinense TaxID=2970906 RepID=UPI0032DF1A1A